MNCRHISSYLLVFAAGLPQFICMIYTFVVDAFIDELPDELFEPKNGEAEENNSKTNELQQLLENETQNNNLSSNKMHPTANSVAIVGKDLSNPNSPLINSCSNSVPSPNFNKTTVSPSQITTSATKSSTPNTVPNMIASPAIMNSQHHQGPSNRAKTPISNTMSTVTPMTSVPQNFSLPGYNAASSPGHVNPALSSRMRSNLVSNQNSSSMNNFSRHMTVDQTNHINALNSMSVNTMVTVKSEPNYMMGQPGLPINHTGVTANHVGMTGNQAGIPLNQGTMTMNQGPLSVNPPGMASNQVGVPVNPSGIPINHSGIPVNQNIMPAAQGGLQMNQGGIPLNQGGMQLNHARIPVNQTGVAINQGGLSLNHGGMGINQNAVSVNQGGLTMNLGGITLGEVSLNLFFLVKTFIISQKKYIRYILNSVYFLTVVTIFEFACCFSSAKHQQNILYHNMLIVKMS